MKKTETTQTAVKTANSKLVERAAHCKIALDCYTPKLQRAALKAIAKMKGVRPSESDVKAVCSDLSNDGLKVLDVLINSLLDSLAGLTLEDRVLVTEALIAALPEVERKFEERAETDRLLDKILNDILAKLSNAQLETILNQVQLEATLKEVMASDDYVRVFILAVTDPEMANKIHSELLEQESQDEQDETEFPEYAPIAAFLESMTDREKVICALMAGLRSAANHSSSGACRYLEELGYGKQKACIKDATALVSNPEFGAMATTAIVLETMGH